MNVKNYRGKSADECLKKLKLDLGADAVILQSRTVRPFLGRFGKPMHEIVAAGDAAAVLDQLAEQAGERRLEEREEPAGSDLASSKTQPSGQAEARLTLSSGKSGNNVLAAQAQSAARRERLTLAEAAELHEQGAYDRLIAAGVLQTKTAAPAGLARDVDLAEGTSPGAGDLRIVYAGASAAEKSPAADEERIARLERQIALLASSLQKQTELTSAPRVEQTLRATTAPADDVKSVAAANPLPEFKSAPVLAPRIAQAPVPTHGTQERPISAAATPQAAPSDEAENSANAVATAQAPVTGLGGFLRYRLPAQPADKAPATKAHEANGTRVASLKRVAPQASAGQIPQSAATLGADNLAEPLPANAALPYLKALRSSQVAEPLLRRIGSEVPNDVAPADAREVVHDLLTQRMLIGGAITAPMNGKMTLAALLGPTGVGKTTTIAKVAASLTLTGSCRVALVTLDTSRVAAADQLKGYGEAMGIPVRVAYDRMELESVLMEFARDKVQVVLIDTPGRGPLETLSLAEMSQSLRSLVDLRSYVVIPAPLSASNFENTIQRFIKIAKPNALILTKMDETADNHCLGFLLNAQAKYHLPLAYVTMGARVPDDLLVADAHLLVNKLMNTGL